MLKYLSLQNFRSYTRTEFSFNPQITFIIGPNTAGKTNLMEAIYLVSAGKSFRAEKDLDLIQFGKNIARVKATAGPSLEGVELEIVLASLTDKEGVSKKYLVNGVGKRRVDFASHLPIVLFSPLDLEILAGSPGRWRDFLDNILEQTDREYRHALIEYTKGLRQRNALLALTQETGKYNEKQFEYWNDLLIKNGMVISKKRASLIEYFNSTRKDIFDFVVYFDHSIISKERLEKYKEAEKASGVTLVGPHRDDFSVSMYDNEDKTTHSVKAFGSRGQQRLVILQLKILQLLYMEKAIGSRPLLLLDDIFSELDNEHIKHVLDLIENQQTIITTTHKEFIPKDMTKKSSMVELKGNGRV